MNRNSKDAIRVYRSVFDIDLKDANQIREYINRIELDAVDLEFLNVRNIDLTNKMAVEQWLNLLDLGDMLASIFCYIPAMDQDGNYIIHNGHSVNSVKRIVRNGDGKKVYEQRIDGIRIPKLENISVLPLPALGDFYRSGPAAISWGSSVTPNSSQAKVEGFFNQEGRLVTNYSQVNPTQFYDLKQEIRQSIGGRQDRAELVFVKISNCVKDEAGKVIQDAITSTMWVDYDMRDRMLRIRQVDYDNFLLSSNKPLQYDVLSTDVEAGQITSLILELAKKNDPKSRDMLKRTLNSTRKLIESEGSIDDETLFGKDEESKEQEEINDVDESSDVTVNNNVKQEYTPKTSIAKRKFNRKR